MCVFDLQINLDFMWLSIRINCLAEHLFEKWLAGKLLPIGPMRSAISVLFRVA